LKTGDFHRLALSLSTLTIQDLAKAAEEERNNKPISNTAVRDLRKHAKFSAAKVMGSDSARQRVRSQIWSTVAWFNAPSVWLTINPDDLHDPIAQVFAGEEINLDDFVNLAGPDKTTQAQNIAKDPCAAAEFFDFIVTTVLHNLFQVCQLYINNIVVHRALS